MPASLALARGPTGTWQQNSFLRWDADLYLRWNSLNKQKNLRYADDFTPNVNEPLIFIILAVLRV